MTNKTKNDEGSILQTRTQHVLENPASSLRRLVRGLTHGLWRAYDHQQQGSSRTGNCVASTMMVMIAVVVEPIDDEVRQQNSKKKKKLLWQFYAVAFRLRLVGARL